MWWLALIIFVAFCFLLFHCYKTRGYHYTLKVFLGGTLIFIAKEIQNQFNEPVRYRATEAAFTFLHVPWAVVMGWVFAMYVGLVVAERILWDYSKRRYGSVFPTIGVASLVVFAISLNMEVHGTQMQWWVWTADRANEFRPLLLGLPVLVPLEWTRVCFTVLTFALLLEFTELRFNKWRYLHFLASFLVTLPLFVIEKYMDTKGGSDFQYDKPLLLLAMAAVFIVVSWLMIRKRRSWTELYLFNFSFQIYNFFIDPFTWYAGAWILLHAFGFLLYTKVKFCDDWLIFSRFESQKNLDEDRNYVKE